MITELGAPQDQDPIEAINAAAQTLGLEIKQGTLKKYPGSTHWHLTKPGNGGTLEITFDPRSNRLWIEQRANRTSEWQEPVVQALAETFPPSG